MAHPEYIRAKAIQMRVERGFTIDEIAERLALSRTTIYYWVKDVPLSRKGRANAGQRLGNLSMQRNWRELREAAYAQGAAEFADLSVDRSFLDFVCLYIAEGYKRSRNTACICNSDAAVMKVGSQR